ncbi:MAG: VIT1/CCC1 transporter family protein [Silvanigrellaceae bacterium]|nr:VIT1/CCC1 transporter family protein [Silvanigrellaceae bacterium]
MSKEHTEEHFYAKEFVKDIVLGMSDGLTVPFALSAGLSMAFSSNSLIFSVGVLEIIAGSIAMGCGGFLAHQNEMDHYMRELQREKHEIIAVPHLEEAEIRTILKKYHIEKTEVDGFLDLLKKYPDFFTDFMLKFELNMSKPDPRRPWMSALTIGLAYAVGGFVPLLPYLLAANTKTAFSLSLLSTCLFLIFFGYCKGRLLGSPALKSALQTLFIGGCAAGSAYFFAQLLI